MGGTEVISGIIGLFVGLIVYIVDSIVENTITDACFSIIYDMADSASQYDPATGALIGLIPAFISGLLTFAAAEAILKPIEASM